MSAYYGKPLADLATAEQDAQIVALKRTGMSYETIGSHLGISRSTAHRGFHRALRMVVEPEVTAIRSEQLAHIEGHREILRDIIAARHILVSNGQLIREDGVPLADDGPVMAAIALMSKLDDQEARLTGAYPATRMAVEATVNYTVGGGVDLSALS